MFDNQITEGILASLPELTDIDQIRAVHREMDGWEQMGYLRWLEQKASAVTAIASAQNSPTNNG